MRLAVEEQWGGLDSADKRDFLISHICDTYGGEPGASSLGPFEPTRSPSAASPPAPEMPEPEDLAELLGGYFIDEFEAHVEDGSCDYIAERIVQLHKVIFAQPDVTLASPRSASLGDAAEAAQRVLQQAQRAVALLDEAAEKLRSESLPKVHQGRGNEEEDAESEENGDEDDDSGASGGAMNVDVADNSSLQPTQPSRPGPIVDGDGFTTVIRSKKK